MPQVTDHPHQGALKGRESLTIPDDLPANDQTSSDTYLDMTRRGLEIPRFVLLASR